MRLTAEELRASVSAAASFVAAAYARFDPPFDEDSVGVRLTGLPGVRSAVADRLAPGYRAVRDEVGDGGKAALLIACRVVEELAGVRRGIPDGLTAAAERAAEVVAGRAARLRNPADVERAAVTAAGGDTTIGAAICEALSRAGVDGVIHVLAGDAGHPPGVTIEDGEMIGPRGAVETVWVRGATRAETAALYARGCGALHSAVAAIGYGVVPGGGAGYAVAAAQLMGDGPAARALAAGLEVPFRTRGAAAGLDPEPLFAALRADPGLAFDQTRPGLVPSAETGPIDAVRVVRAVILEAGQAAIDLLRLL